YRLIWERFLASQMNPAVYDTVSADIEAGRAIFRAQGQTLKFKGFTAVYVESREEEASDDEDAERAMPLLEEGERLTLLGLDPKRAKQEMKSEKAGEPTGEACPECGEDLLKRRGRFGPFIACSAYPECRYTRNLNGEGKVEDETTNETCATCGRPMVIKHGRFGKFIACSGYPECKTTKPVTLGIPCPESGCAGELVQRRSKRGRTFYGCS